MCWLIAIGKAEHEREYIRNEVRRLVRRNANIRSEKQIAEKLDEFEARIETGVHYKIPYPRPVNVTPGSTGKTPEVVTPVYLHSYDEKHVRARPQIGHQKPVYEE